MEYGRWVFSMQQDAGGSSLADHYALLARKGHIEQPRAPELPKEAIHVWNIYARLRSAHPSTGMGFSAISYSEIKAYSDVVGWDFDPWEIEAINRLDDALDEARSTKGPQK